MYSCNVLDEQYAGAMAEHGFVPEPDNRRYGSMGLCWRQAPVEAANSGPMGSRTSICSKSTISNFMRISFWSFAGRRA